MLHYKPLHVARSLQDLNQIINNNDSNWRKIPRPKDAAKKLYLESQSDPLDEERTYILLSRFLILYNFLLKKSEDSYQIRLLLGKEATKASIQLEMLTASLDKRYKELIKRNSEASPVVAVTILKRKSVFKSRKDPFVNCGELHQALKHFNLLIMDCRDIEQFEQSHIRDVTCINIPENLIHSGLSGNTLGITLPTDTIEQWEKRDSFDVIVLLDWCTSYNNFPASKLDKLRTILLEWDIDRTYHEPPMVLNNGYREWIDFYPTLCTNSEIKYTEANIDLDEFLNLEAIIYPCELAPIPSSKVDPNKKNQETQEPKEPALNPQSIDTSTDNDVHTPSFHPVDDLLKKGEEERLRLLQQARQAKKPEIYFEIKSLDKPVIDRATKPKNADSSIDVTAVSNSIMPGFTGLVNINNTCYLNTIIQCLRHIPEIIEFYCNFHYKKTIRQPPVISEEIADLIRRLWNTNNDIIKPIEFYNKLTMITNSYNDGRHEDCMEFFIQLFTFLSEDCAFDVVSKPIWSDTQLTWHQQMGGKSSFFIDKFYYQIKITHVCHRCSTRHIKYEIENVFYLNVPNNSFHLEDCMASYLHENERFVCKKCNTIKTVVKDISRFPPVLVISLKRHIQEEIAHNVYSFKKNSNICYFPIEDFNVHGVHYSLIAISLHSGETESGHYTAACLNPNSKKWYLYNDEMVLPLNIHDDSVGIKAYTFFYSQKKE